jgi:hypothetical protein
VYFGGEWRNLMLAGDEKHVLDLSSLARDDTS